MKNRMLLGGLVLAVLSVNVWAAGEAAQPQEGAIKVLGAGEVSFKKDVQPILHDYCISCHQPGGKGYVKSGLDLTSYEGLMKGTNFGKVVVPGNSETSTFTKLLTGTNKGLKMPAGLNASGTLDRQYILTLRKWVKQGAKNN
ncbi:MAG TPA: c-type cytochrome domain-containing protein [Sideroxyarcus sp.]|nr:c-type cytochrome domain-containing protein [Sideroxyarcus sp.]